VNDRPGAISRPGAIGFTSPPSAYRIDDPSIYDLGARLCAAVPRERRAVGAKPWILGLGQLLHVSEGFWKVGITGWKVLGRPGRYPFGQSHGILVGYCPSCVSRHLEGVAQASPESDRALRKNKEGL
jgi:hypothetical protein